MQKSFHLSNPKEIQNIFSSPSNKIKTPDTQTNPTKTWKHNNDNGLQTRWTRTPASNSVLPQLAVTCKIEAEYSYQTFVQVDSEVLRNRQLRQHAKRYDSSDISVEFRKDIYNEKYLQSLDLNERQVKALLFTKDKGKITNRQYQTLNNCSRNTASNDLSELVDKEFLKPSGQKGAGAFYTLK